MNNAMPGHFEPDQLADENVIDQHVVSVPFTVIFGGNWNVIDPTEAATTDERADRAGGSTRRTG